MIFKTNKINKKLFALFLACLFLLPAVGLASLKLEQRYPDIPGFSQSINKVVDETVQKNQGVSVSALIKYLTDLVLVLAIGAATISLIVAGIQYLTNAGNKGALGTARTRIFKSMLGIAILIGSYLILNLIMPDFQIPKLEKIYVSSQVVLFTQEGATALEELNQINFTKDTIDELVTQGKARYFSSQWIDTTEHLGNLKEQISGGPINFDFFPAVGLGIMGNGASNIKVLTFAGKGFTGDEVRYGIKGVTGKNEESLSITPPPFSSPIKSFTETLYYFNLKKLSSEVTYELAGATFSEETKKILHPPLSIAVVGIGPGVYLYNVNIPIPLPGIPNNPTGVDFPGYYKPPPGYPPGAPAPPTVPAVPAVPAPPTSGSNEQRYLQSSVSDFNDQSFAFDDMATQIELRNNNKPAPAAKENDLMAVLFDDADYRGGFRIFFEKRDVNIPLVYIKNALKGSWTGNAQNLSDEKMVNDYMSGDGKFQLNNEATNIGNIGLLPPGQDIGKVENVAGVDMLGKVEGASSIKIFNLTEIVNGCEEVRLCNQADLGGYCLSFTPFGQRISGLYNALTLPMPWFVPVSIPEYLMAKQDGDAENLGGYLESNVLVGERDLSGDGPGVLSDGDNKSFAGNIRSIGIDGNCAVALFENSVKNPTNCFSPTNADPNQCWNNGGPGEKSQMFSYNDMIQPKGNQISYLNLSDQPIGSCTKREWLIRLKITPCASAIAVFPVK